MEVICANCASPYDDARQDRRCPHTPLLTPELTARLAEHRPDLLEFLDDPLNPKFDEMRLGLLRHIAQSERGRKTLREAIEWRDRHVTTPDDPDVAAQEDGDTFLETNAAMDWATRRQMRSNLERVADGDPPRDF